MNKSGTAVYHRLFAKRQGAFFYAGAKAFFAAALALHRAEAATGLMAFKHLLQAHSHRQIWCALFLSY
ncbi:MAG: hypothetical protein LUH82_05970 [Clostridiales bacterium]|nr:hypothetical protein [Clostridiales bacterium]